MSEAEKWAKSTNDFKRSGKSQRIWCLEQGIQRSSLRYWLERLDELSDGSEIVFAEVAVKGSEKS